MVSHCPVDRLSPGPTSNRGLGAGLFSVVQGLRRSQSATIVLCLGSFDPCIPQEMSTGLRGGHTYMFSPEFVEDGSSLSSITGGFQTCRLCKWRTEPSASPRLTYHSPPTPPPSLSLGAQQRCQMELSPGLPGLVSPSQALLETRAMVASP